MGEIYERIDCMLGEIIDVLKNGSHASDLIRMNEILVNRWEKMNIPMHCLGFSVNSHNYDANYLIMRAPGGASKSRFGGC